MHNETTTCSLEIKHGKFDGDKVEVHYLDHVYLRHLSTKCRSILSADMATDTRLIYRPTLGRYVGRVSVECRSSVGRHVGFS